MRVLRVTPLLLVVAAMAGATAMIVRGPVLGAWQVVRGSSADGRPADVQLATLLLGGSAVVLAVACCWLVLAVASCTWELLQARGPHPTRPGPEAVVAAPSVLRPQLVRACVAACLGVGAVGSAPAHAQPPSPVAVPSSHRDPAPLDRGLERQDRAASGSTGAQVLDGLPLPDRVTGGAPGELRGGRPGETGTESGKRAARGPDLKAGTSRHASDVRSPDRGTDHPADRSADPPAADPATTLVVRPGDSLWSLTAGLLPPDAPAAEVSAAWPLLYRANRGVVGDDPDLLRPGQLLHVDRALLGLLRAAGPHTPLTHTDRRSP